MLDQDIQVSFKQFQTVLHLQLIIIRAGVLTLFSALLGWFHGDQRGLWGHGSATDLVWARVWWESAGCCKYLSQLNAAAATLQSDSPTIRSDRGGVHDWTLCDGDTRALVIRQTTLPCCSAAVPVSSSADCCIWEHNQTTSITADNVYYETFSELFQEIMRWNHWSNAPMLQSNFQKKFLTNVFCL